jgi:hypothetical protein
MSARTDYPLGAVMLAPYRERPWCHVPRDARTTSPDGTRRVLAWVDGVGTCLVPWIGPREATS